MSRRKIPGRWITRADGTQAWRLPYRDPATGRQTSRVFDNKTGDDGAESFYDELMGGKRSGTWVPPDAGRELVMVFAREWAEIEAVAERWAPGTVESVGYHLKRIERLLTVKRLDQVDPLVLKRLSGDLSQRYASAKITMHYATRIMRAAYHAGRIRRDVTIGVKAPRRRGDDDHRVGPVDVPTRNELVAIFDAAPARFRAAIVLGACGLRVSEAIGVTVDRLDLERRSLVVDRQLTFSTGRYSFKPPKRDKCRTIELPSWALLELRRHLRDHGPFWSLRGQPADEWLLFRGGRDAPMRRDAFYDVGWRPALVGAGLAANRYKFHSLRHWCASSLLAAGAPITAVAGHLGDVPETVMRTYAHWLRDERSLPATLLDQALARPSSEVAR